MSQVSMIRLKEVFLTPNNTNNQHMVRRISGAIAPNSEACLHECRFFDSTASNWQREGGDG